MVPPIEQRSPVYGLLISMASVRASSALAAWQSPPQPGIGRMALDAGIAAELVAKAYLAAHSPALLIPDRAPRDTLLHLAGVGELAVTPLYELQTIGMSEAMKRVRYLLPSFSYDPATDRELLLCRNAVAHLGDVPETLVHRALQSMVRIHGELAREIGDWNGGDFIEEYWDDDAEVVRHLLDEGVSEVDRVARAKIALAKRDGMKAFRRLDPDERRRLARMLAGWPQWGAPAEDALCPACGEVGVLAYSLQDIGEPYQRPHPRTGETVTYSKRRATVLGFDCSACGLSLEGAEAGAAGLALQAEPPDGPVMGH